MEGPEVPLEHLHEEIHHHAQHAGVPWISWVALSTAILAVLAAIAGLLAGMHANEAMMSQIQASDQWGYYQAKSIKAAILEAKTTLASEATARDKEKAAQYQDEQAEIKREAEHKEAEAKTNFHKHEVFARGRNHVPNRDCHRADFRAHKETQILDREFDFWRCRLCVSGPGGNLRQG